MEADPELTAKRAKLLAECVRSVRKIEPFDAAFKALNEFDFQHPEVLAYFKAKEQQPK